MTNSSDNNKALAVAALRSGTVIDHIPASSLFKVVEILDIPSMKEAVTIGFNLESTQMRRKGIIKIDRTELPDNIINRIAIAAPGASINIIRDYKVVSKFQVSLPEEIEGVVVCNNPKCISRNEPMPSRFHVIDPAGPRIRCCYCEREMQGDEIIIA